MRIGLLISTLISAAFAACIVYMALDHNPQGEFFDQETGELHWNTLFPLVAIPFCESFVICMFVTVILVFTGRSSRTTDEGDGTGESTLP